MPQENSPSATNGSPDKLYIIEATTQLHLDGVGIGVGNIWEEEYTSTDGAPRHGLTAGLFISVEKDPSQNRSLRVHSGQEIKVAAYRLQVVSVETRRIQLAVARVSE